MKAVVKVGTSTLAHATGQLNIRRIEGLCKVLSDLKNAGHQIILVSSGAIGMGVGKLGLPGRPADMPTKQAAAAVGQCELMYTYDKLFSEYSHTVAQILITSEDLADPERSENLHNTLARLLELGALPIVNENDTVSTAEIAVGDNDTLAARLCRSLEAELLVILSDIDGLYTPTPTPRRSCCAVWKPSPRRWRRWRGARAAALAPAAWPRNCGRARSSPKRGRTWSSPTAATPRCSTPSLRGAKRAPAFWPERRPPDDHP